MAEWKRVKLGEVITDIAAGPFGSNLKISCFVDDGFPIIDGANLKGFKVSDNITKFVTEQKARSLSRSIAKRNDVVVTISGTLGQIAYVPVDSKYPEYLCSQRQFRASFDETVVNIPYLVYYFHSRKGQQKILVYANQVGVPALYQPLKNFREIEIELPPLPTQRKIAAVLGALDDKIENNRKICANLEAQAQALFRNSDRGPEIEFTSEINVLGGGTPKTSEPKYWGGDIPFFSPKDVGSPYATSTERTITSEGLNNCNSELYPAETTFVTARGTVGKVCLTGLPMAMNQSCFALRSQSIDPLLVYFYTKASISSLKNKANGSVFDAITVAEFETEKLCRLTRPSESRFLSVARPMFDEILRRTRESTNLASLRDALLPKLMSGEIDVEKVEV